MAIQMTVPSVGNTDPQLTALIDQLRGLQRSLVEAEAKPMATSSQPIRPSQPKSGKKEQRSRF